MESSGGRRRQKAWNKYKEREREGKGCLEVKIEGRVCSGEEREVFSEGEKGKKGGDK